MGKISHTSTINEVNLSDIGKSECEEKQRRLLKGKLGGSIFLFGLIVVAIFDRTIYLPGREGFIHESENPTLFMFMFLVLVFLSGLSFYQGYTGLYTKSKT